MTSVKVAVRVRPFNKREKEMNAELIIGMVDNQTTITNPVRYSLNSFKNIASANLMNLNLHRKPERKKSSLSITVIGATMATKNSPMATFKPPLAQNIQTKIWFSKIWYLLFDF
jgi:hypothetical protein